MSCELGAIVAEAQEFLAVHLTRRVLPTRFLPSAFVTPPSQDELDRAWQRAAKAMEMARFTDFVFRDHEGNEVYRMTPAQMYRQMDTVTPFEELHGSLSLEDFDEEYH